MARKMEYGDWAQVVGKFDLEAGTGAILSMLPAKVAFSSLDGGEQRVLLKGLAEDQSMIFELAVNPLKPSCGVTGSEFMFEEFVPVTPKLQDVKLFINGNEVANFVPGAPEPKGQLTLGAALENRLHHIPLDGDVPAEENVSYSLQVRPEGDTRWHTMAAGLNKPSMADVDINQFPGAAAIDIRVLRTNGLETKEILSENKKF